jgi:hypothetical protein
MLQYLDDDVLRGIMSFLGYKKLVRVRGVCKVWKILADDDCLWFPLYRRRFGLLGEEIDDYKANNNGLWKKRFTDKWLAERSIRFQYNRTEDFKYRICGYIGCRHVVKSPAGLKSHYGMHKRRKERVEKKRLHRLSKQATQPKANALKNSPPSQQHCAKPATKKREASQQQRARPATKKREASKQKHAKPATKKRAKPATGQNKSHKRLKPASAPEKSVITID